MSGWIKSHRQMWRNPIFEGNAMRVGVWHWILQSAAWKPTKFVIGSEIIDLEAGQVCVSQAQVTKATGITRQQLRTFLKLLESDGTITLENTSKAAQKSTKGITKGRTIITICNYTEYQDSQPTANQPPTNRQPTKEEVEEVKKVKTSKRGASATRAVAIPEGWVPNEKNIEHALSKQLTRMEINDEADKFRDYHLARGTTFKNWDAGWRTWVSNAIKFRSRGMAGKSNSSGHGQSGSLASIVARREAERQGRG